MENLATLLQQPISYEGIAPQYALQIAQQQANAIDLAKALAEVMQKRQALDLQRLEVINNEKYRQKSLELEKQRVAIQRLMQEIEGKRVGIEEKRLGLEKERLGIAKAKAATDKKLVEARLKEAGARESEAKAGEEEAKARASLYKKQLEELDTKKKLLDQLNGIKVPIMGHEVSLATLLQVNGGASLLKSAEPDKALERVETFQKLYKKTGKPWLSLSLTFGKLPSNDFGMLQLKNELESLGGQGEGAPTLPFDLGSGENNKNNKGSQTPLLTPEEIEALTNALGGNK